MEISRTPAPSAADPGTSFAPLRSALSREQAEATAGLLRVVSDPTRLQLLSLIHHAPSRDATVSELTAALGLRQPTVTYHLKMLTDAGVIQREARGRHVRCSIVPERLSAISDLLR